VYQVCSGEDRPIAALAEALLARARRPMRLETDPALLRPVEVPALRGTFEKIEREVGWRPVIPLETTIEALLDEARARVRVPAP
jgi:GDP-4-dehydro-6-deoxy-D-mannose reductase